MIARSFKLLDIPGELLLQNVEAIADSLSKFIGKSTKLLARFFRKEQLICHWI